MRKLILLLLLTFLSFSVNSQIIINSYIFATEGGSIPIVENFTVTTDEFIATSLVITKTGNIIANNLLLIFIGNDHNQISTNFSTPSGWTKLIEIGDGVSDAHTGIYYKIATGSEPATETISWTGDRESYAYYIRVSGVDTSNPINITGSEAIVGDGTTHVITGLTTTLDNCLAFYVITFDGGDLSPFSVAGTGWSESAEVNAGTTASDVSGAWGTKGMPTAGVTGSATVTSSAVDGSGSIQFSINSN